MIPRIIINLGMKAILLALLIQISKSEEYSDIWHSFPACRMGRLQSPIKLNITNSVYSSTYSIVYQNYGEIEDSKQEIKEAGKGPVAASSTFSGGSINFQKGGVIKQYELIKFELYRGSHQVELDQSEYELHIIHKKVLGFTSSQNRYKTIQDANNYLVIVLRYSQNGTTSDNGLLENLTTQNAKFDLSDYPVFQEKRSYYYEGAFMFNPCDEDVNYIVIEAPYKIDSTTGITLYDGKPSDYGKKDLVYSYERPIYRNFMNYTESLYSFTQFPSFMLILLLLLQL